MNQSEHIEMIIGNLNTTIMGLLEKYNLPIYVAIEKLISSCSIEELTLNNEKSIYDQLNGIYKKILKNFFYDIKKINFLGNPKLYYYKDNTIKISCDILDTLWFDGSCDNIFFIINTYLKKLEDFLKQLDFIKYVQYVLDIPGLKLEIGKEKLTIEDSGIIVAFPFKTEDVDQVVDLIKPELSDKKMEIMSSVLLLRKTGNDMYIPQKYEDYYLPEIFQLCLDNFYINGVNQPKYVKVFYKGEFVQVVYLSAYEFMNNKTNKPFCYFYIKNNQLLDIDTQNKMALLANFVINHI